mmetsp:Transcript_8500/g.23990  ORF Transcript_8500/g.23990 Transcript_8500/m.23990 type:complete len:236 (+) Transcript_8500:598-1305(+)
MDSMMRRYPSPTSSPVATAAARVAMSPHSRPNLAARYSRKWKSARTCTRGRCFSPCRKSLSSAIPWGVRRFSMGNSHLRGPSWSRMFTGHRNHSLSTCFASRPATTTGFSMPGSSGLVSSLIPLSMGDPSNQPSLTSLVHCSEHWYASNSTWLPSSEWQMETTAVTNVSPSRLCQRPMSTTSAVLSRWSLSSELCEKIHPTRFMPSTPASLSTVAASSPSQCSSSEEAVPSWGGS